MTTAEPLDLDAAAAAAPVTGRPEQKSSWVYRPRELAALMRSVPGDISYPDSDPRSGWRVCATSDNPARRAVLSSDAMRIRTKGPDDPNRGVLAPFRVSPDEKGRLPMFQASVHAGSDNPGGHAVVLVARYLTPEQAELVRRDLDIVRRAGVKRIAHRSVTRADETPSDRADRLAAAAARRRARTESATTDGN